MTITPGSAVHYYTSEVLMKNQGFFQFGQGINLVDILNRYFGNKI
ncbi:hypothetical protein VB713_00345 [Anabaena cylindrica UHCC 0172]|nr:hypothetical protein [Anabaena cylindrica UHCC 0172]